MRRTARSTSCFVAFFAGRRRSPCAASIKERAPACVSSIGQSLLTGVRDVEALRAGLRASSFLSGKWVGVHRGDTGTQRRHGVVQISVRPPCPPCLRGELCPLKPKNEWPPGRTRLRRTRAAINLSFHNLTLSDIMPPPHGNRNLMVPTPDRWRDKNIRIGDGLSHWFIGSFLH